MMHLKKNSVCGNPGLLFSCRDKSLPVSPFILTTDNSKYCGTNRLRCIFTADVGRTDIKQQLIFMKIQTSFKFKY